MLSDLLLLGMAFCVGMFSAWLSTTSWGRRVLGDWRTYWIPRPGAVDRVWKLEDRS